MSYSIINTGRSKVRQSEAVLSDLSRQEQANIRTREAIEGAEKQQKAGTVGNLAGMAATDAVEGYVANKAAEATATRAAESAIGQGMAAEAAAIDAGASATAANMAGTSATAAGTASAAGGAAGAAGAAGGSAASTGIMAAMGPIGWAALAGALIFSFT